jgi:hypothetical protein
MLYGQLSKDVWATALPSHWDKAMYMYKYLHRMTFEYTLEFSQAMFSVTEPRFQCTLLKWENGLGSASERKRNVLLETTDPAHMEAVLLLLISEAEVVDKARRSQRAAIPISELF